METARDARPVESAPGAPPIERCGRFELLEPIARGAMGAVYRACDPESGDVVALKTLRAADPGDFELLRREIHALSRIQHPGVVRLLAYGVDAGAPWYAMELIEGGTLADLWRNGGAAAVPAVPTAEARGRSLRLLERVCGPLAFLHGEGVVHRDLKPSNIAIRPGADEPIIVDFGLVGYWGAALAREALQPGGEIIGTACYMAPEQARGEYVDARADLYSLGCLLYEAVTGRPPFDGAAGEVVMQHLERPPPPPSHHVPDLDPRLDELILRLLAKEPSGRLGFASDVAAILREVTGDAEPPAARRIESYLYRPAFVGRAQVYTELLGTLDDVRTARGACVFVGGDSGSGKTRFAMEITRAAAGRGFAVITGECAAVEGAHAAGQVHGAPLHPLQPLLRAAAERCMCDGPAATARVVGRGAKVLAPFEPMLRLIPGYDDQPEPAVLSPAAERDRLLRSLAELLVGLTSEKPVLMVLDDLQWADDMTLALLESLGDAFFARARLLVLGSFRSEEVTPALAGVLEAPHVRRIDLNRLDGAEVGEIVSSMLAIEQPPRQLVRLLARESEGNPFFVGEYLRAAVEAGFLHRAASAGWLMDAAAVADEPGALPLPHTLRELIERRTAHLESAAAAFMEAGAVLGREFDADLAGALLHVGDPHLMEAVRQLVQRQILEPVHGNRLRFSHDKLREAAYARLSNPAAAVLHRDAAVAIEARHSAGIAQLSDDNLRPVGTPPTTTALVARTDVAAHPDCVELAHHWERAGVNDRAVHYLSQGGERALASGAYKDAHWMISRGLVLDANSIGPTAPFRHARWQRMLGVAAFGIGDLEGSIAHSAEALQGLREPVPRSPLGWGSVAVWELGRALVVRDRPDRSPERRGIRYEAAQACGQLATSHFYNADVVPALANLLRGLNRARKAGDDIVLAESCARIGYVAGAVGLGPVARRMFRRAHHIADRSHDTSRRALALYLEAMYREFLGQWDVCRRLAEEAAEILSTVGDLSEAETARAIASHGYFFAGQVRTARALGAAILHTAEERSHKHHIGWGLYLVARCDVVLGEVDAGIARLEQARVLLESLPDAIDIVICEGWLARAFALSRRWDEASAVAAKLAERILGGKRPAVGQCVDGFAGWAETALADWQRVPDSPAAARQALRACTELRRFARIFRMAQPAALRCSAQALWLGGRPGRALRRWNKSVHSARTLQMPYEEVRAYAALARVSDAADAARYRAAAQRALDGLGCSGLSVESL